MTTRQTKAARPIFLPKEPHLSSVELVRDLVDAAEKLGRLKRAACRRLGTMNNNDLDYLAQYHIAHGEAIAPPNKDAVRRERETRDRLTRAIRRGHRKRR